MRGVYRAQNTGIIRSHVMKIYPAAVRHRGEAASDWRMGLVQSSHWLTSPVAASLAP